MARSWCGYTNTPNQLKSHSFKAAGIQIFPPVPLTLIFKTPQHQNLLRSSENLAAPTGIQNENDIWIQPNHIASSFEDLDHCGRDTNGF